MDARLKGADQVTELSPVDCITETPEPQAEMDGLGQHRAEELF